MFKKVVAFLFLASLCMSNILAQKFYQKSDVEVQNKWADSVFNALSPEQRLGQLFMVAAYSNRNEEHYQEIDALINDYNIGGLIFFQGGAYRQAKLNNRYQSLAKVPLLIAMDAEWGIGMRLDSIMDFPKQMTLGAIKDDRWIYEMGKAVANQFHALNMHINFAPVVDVNVNPNNPVIGYRSFGEDKNNVARKGTAYMKGMQDYGIMANAKHFPGHGDTGVDSHYDLPVIPHSQERMSETELYPFRALMKDSLLSVMVAHLQVPAYDDRENTPTTLSNKVVTDLLKTELAFDGLVFTDAMNMQGVAKYYEPGEADVKALQAGNDVILFPMDVPEAVKQVQKALKKGKLDQESIDERVKKVLRAKYWAGLNKSQQVVIDNLTKRINTDQASLLNRMLYQKAITVVDNTDKLIPQIGVKDKQFASLLMGGKDGSEFRKMLDMYAPFEHLELDSLSSEFIDVLSQKDVVVIGYQGISNSPRDQHKVNSEEVQFIKQLQAKTKVIVVTFGNAYALKYFEGVENIICTYEDNNITQSLAPQVIFGALKAEGKLPVSTGAFNAGTGIETLTTGRLSYGRPEEVEMSLDTLRQIDEIIEAAIEDKATPGAQIIVARKGKVIYDKAFGYQTYDEKLPINHKSIYDIASVTKVAATTQAIMKLYEEQKLDINKPIGFYLDELKGTNKEDLLVRDILTHQSGLKSYWPFWQRILEDGELKTDYQVSIEGPHDYRIGNFELPTTLADSLWKWTVDTDLNEMPKGKNNHEYLYSDIGYTLIYRLVSKLLDRPLQDYVNEEFYKPLGLRSTTFLPREKGFYTDVVPSEVDDYFRNTIVCAEVNDQNTILTGGIAGHAGLFSTANDLAILMQMNMQMGQYAGNQYFNNWTIPIFTSAQNMENRRGLGWDKPITGTKDGPTSKFSSASTFGHTGYTGAAIWADPAEELVFIFLCNRTYPESENFKLIEDNVRTRIHDLLYKATMEP